MKPEALLADFSHALGQLEDALKISADHDRVGCIQYFVLTFELAWKTIRCIAAIDGHDPGGSPKSCLRAAFLRKWIDEEAIWLEMLNARHRMFHTYDAKDAVVICEQLPAFINPMVELLAHLQQSLHIGGGE
jgi:nucleotidyltransferase substrate binding protein (TIGR01987 family)